jgi:voltage-gated sodium channel
MGIARPVMEVHPYAWAFFVPFILIITFAVLNLFIAIVVNAMANAAAAEEGSPAGGEAKGQSSIPVGQVETEAGRAEREQLLQEVILLRREIRTLKKALAPM